MLPESEVGAMGNLLGWMISMPSGPVAVSTVVLDWVMSISVGCS